MGEAQVNFYLQRLEYLLLHEADIFAALADHIQGIIGSLKQISDFFGCIRNSESDSASQKWVNDLNESVSSMDDQIDEFIFQFYKNLEPDDSSNLIERFRVELQRTQSQLAEIVQRTTHLNKSTLIEEEEEAKEVTDNQIDQASSSSVSFSLKYKNLPYYLKSILLYCCIFPENHWISKGKLIRLLVAEGLVNENTGQLLEDIAEQNIDELISQGMLEIKDDHTRNGTKLAVSSPFRSILQENFTTARDGSDINVPRAARRVLTSDLKKTRHNMNNVHPRSLFLLRDQEVDKNWMDLQWAKYLRVLDFEDTKITNLQNEAEDLVHLTYLGLKGTDITELPARIGRLRGLQTLDIRWCGRISELSEVILSLTRLRHLKMFKNSGISGVKLPKGIGRLTNLLTLTGVHASVAEELAELTQLRKLSVMDVSEEYINELFSSISQMKGLLSLSLEAKHKPKIAFREKLLLLESFSPPPSLKKLRLEGTLEKVPSWFGLTENLTELRLGFSRVSENLSLVLQELPNLRKLTLWHAYEARQLGKEFCRAGGFPKLEVLIIASHVLEEWTEVEEGALPSLQYLHLHNCLSLRMLPEGLQFVLTLKRLDLLPLLDEHIERLKPDGGEENYKIRHIESVSFISMSRVSQLASGHPCHQIAK